MSHGQSRIFKFDLLGQPLPKTGATKEKFTFTLAPGACHCLAPAPQPAGLSGEAYRRARAQAAWALEALGKIMPVEAIDGLDWRWLAEQVEQSPADFLAAAGEFAARRPKASLAGLLHDAEQRKIFPRVITWTLLDARRVTPVPPGHWLLIQDGAPFRATLQMQKAEGGRQNENGGAIHVQSVAVADGYIACFPPRETAADAELILERMRRIAAHLRCRSFSGARSEIRNPQSAIRRSGPVDERHRWHGAHAAWTWAG